MKGNAQTLARHVSHSCPSGPPVWAVFSNLFCHVEKKKSVTAEWIIGANVSVAAAQAICPGSSGSTLIPTIIGNTWSHSKEQMLSIIVGISLSHPAPVGFASLSFRSRWSIIANSFSVYLDMALGLLQITRQSTKSAIAKDFLQLAHRTGGSRSHVNSTDQS